MQIINQAKRGASVASCILLVGCALTACSLIDKKDNDSEKSTVAEFQDCADCPVMIEIPSGSFMMGTAEADRLIDPRTGYFYYQKTRWYTNIIQYISNIIIAIG